MMAEADILQKTNDYDIYNYYLNPFLNGKELKVGQLMISPLRDDDKHPSFHVYKDSKGSLHHKDFGRNELEGNCFDFVVQLFKIKYTEVYKKIEYDLKLNSKSSNNNPNNNKVNSIKPIRINVIQNNWFQLNERKNFNQKEIDYFQQFGIDVKILNLFNVVPIDGYRRMKDNKKVHSLRTLNRIMIAYKGSEFAKIYSPQPKFFFYLGNIPTEYVFGWEQLPEKGEMVFLTGGEKDVLTLHSLGFNAICLNSETAMPSDDLIKKLKDRFQYVFVMYDIDETGKKESEKICNKFELIPVTLPDSLLTKDGKDISDFVRLGFSIDSIYELIYKAIEDDLFNQDVLTGEQLIDLNIEKVPTLVDPLFQQIGIAIVGGSSDAGKSTLMRQLAISICMGKKDFLGFPINARYNSVIYVSSEDDVYSISFLLNKQNNGIDASSKDLKKLRYIFNTNNVCGKIESELKKERVDLVLVDAFADLYTGDINQVNAVRTYLNQFYNLAKKYKCLIVFIHHCGKNTLDLAPSKRNLLGSQGLEGKARLVIEFRKVVEEDDSVVYHLCVVKCNYLPEEYKTESYVLKMDENMLFYDTKERIPIYTIGKDNIGKKSKLEEKIKIIQEGKAEGLSQREVSEKYGIPKSTVARYWNV